MTIHWKAVEQYFTVVLFVSVCNFSGSESVNVASLPYRVHGDKIYLAFHFPATQQNSFLAN